MSASNSSQRSGGVSFLGLLAVLFIGLKLTGYIAWSWWLVLAPLWGGMVLFLLVFLIALPFIFAAARR